MVAQLLRNEDAVIAQVPRNDDAVVVQVPRNDDDDATRKIVDARGYVYFFLKRFAQNGVQFASFIL